MAGEEGPRVGLSGQDKQVVVPGAKAPLVANLKMVISKKGETKDLLILENK